MINQDNKQHSKSLSPCEKKYVIWKQLVYPWFKLMNQLFVKACHWRRVNKENSSNGLLKHSWFQVVVSEMKLKSIRTCVTRISTISSNLLKVINTPNYIYLFLKQISMLIALLSKTVSQTWSCLMLLMSMDIKTTLVLDCTISILLEFLDTRKWKIDWLLFAKVCI